MYLFMLPAWLKRYGLLARACDAPSWLSRSGRGLPRALSSSCCFCLLLFGLGLGARLQLAARDVEGDCLTCCLALGAREAAMATAPGCGGEAARSSRCSCSERLFPSQR